MRIGTFQFSACADLRANHAKMVSAIDRAAKENVRLLVFDYQEPTPDFGTEGRKVNIDLLLGE